MTKKIDITKHISTGMGRAMLALSAEVEKNMDRRLFELVKIRASQLNQCAYCLDMHTKDAREHGETEQRIYALSAWRDTPFFTDRERTALEWTEALTRLSETHPPEDLRARLAARFDEDEIFALTFSIVVINAWNRLVVPFHPEVGGYQPQAAAASPQTVGA
jgi:AhpD family alkylhydroperoxidase